MVHLLTCATLTAIYTLAIAGLIASLRRIGIGGERTIVLGFLVFGGSSGVLAASLWPVDSAVYANVYAVILGDQVYSWAIHYLGNAHSANAHATIPLLLRVPQVYVFVSLVISGFAGLVVQQMADKRLVGT